MTLQEFLKEDKLVSVELKFDDGHIEEVTCLGYETFVYNNGNLGLTLLGCDSKIKKPTVNDCKYTRGLNHEQTP